MSLFPTEQVAKESQEAAQQKKQQEEQREEMRDYLPVENIEQLYQSLLLPPKHYGFKTINDYMAAGFLIAEELDVVRQLSRAIQADVQLEKILGNGAKLTRSRRIKLNSMLTIAHSSKSREGAAYETLITQKSHNFQKFRDDTEPEESGWGFGGREETPNVGLQIPRQEDVAPDKGRGF